MQRLHGPTLPIWTLLRRWRNGMRIEIGTRLTRASIRPQAIFSAPCASASAVNGPGLALSVNRGLPFSPGPDRARHTALQVVDHTAQGVERGGNHVQHVALPGAEDVVQVPDTAPKLLAVLTPPVLTTPLPQHAAELIEDRQHTVH